MGKIKYDFATIFHLAEIYQEQYREMNLCLSPEQNEASFNDFVRQYYASIRWNIKEPLVLDPSVLVF